MTTCYLSRLSLCYLYSVYMMLLLLAVRNRHFLTQNNTEIHGTHYQFVTDANIKFQLFPRWVMFNHMLCQLLTFG